MEFSRRPTAFSSLKEFCHMAGEQDFIEVTQWSNLEGYDITISDKMGSKIFSVTDGELKAIKKLIKFLDKETDKEFKRNFTERD